MRYTSNFVCIHIYIHIICTPISLSLSLYSSCSYSLYFIVVAIFFFLHATSSAWCLLSNRVIVNVNWIHSVHTHTAAHSVFLFLSVDVSSFFACTLLFHSGKKVLPHAYSMQVVEYKLAYIIATAFLIFIMHRSGFSYLCAHNRSLSLFYLSFTSSVSIFPYFILFLWCDFHLHPLLRFYF